MSAYNSCQMRNLNLRRFVIFTKAFHIKYLLRDRQNRSQPVLTVNEKEFNGYPRRISQIQQQQAVDSESLHKQRQCDDLI